MRSLTRKDNAMGKKMFLVLIVVVTLGMFVTSVFSGENCSPLSASYKGVSYRYCRVTHTTKYDTVQFNNQNTCRVRIDYTTVEYPNTNSTLFLGSGEESEKAAIVPGDSLKTLDVNCV